MKGYTYQKYDKEHMARALGVALPVSFKQSVEICQFIKDRETGAAKKLLQNVVDKKTAVPVRRYNSDLGHKRKIGPGRYPKNTSIEFIKLIEGAEANAQFKGLNTSNLVIAHISAHKAGKSWHFGRKQRTKMKRTSIEIVVQVSKQKEKQTEKSKPAKK
ncbi:50S ribosomal protein L22 [Candidatus Woesearchaeota archaeon]|nr:50S ribosomal protein L22P [uncultured archaeon]MBS3100534.1 50S ribosomal protein L22 [Candidatus Woesearchaeota archaeon]